MIHKEERRRFPKHRQTILEILNASRHVPAFPLLKTLDLARVDAARKNCPVRIGWTSLFVRAYALVSMGIPELRDRFVRLPFSYLYRHPYSVSSVSIHRPDDSGCPRLIWSRIVNGEESSLLQIQQQLSDAISKPLADVYRDGLKLERKPKLYRILSWWLLTQWAGRNHCKKIGTFSVSSLGGQGCLNAFHPLITTSSLAFGPLQDNGRMDVTLICDHRTIDGMLAAQALECLESTLNEEIVEELFLIGSEAIAA